MSDTPFRTRSQEPEIAPQDVPAPEVTDSGNLDKAITSEPEFSPQTELEKWEIQNGLYGLEYLGIKEITKDFKYKMQFGLLDNYIKEELNERKYDKTPSSWQKILNELEDQLGSKGLNAIERLKKLSDYARILKKFNSTKKLKDNYLISDMSN